MKITIEPTGDQSGRPDDEVHSRVTVEHISDDMDIHGVMDLVRGALLAWGFSEKTVDGYMRAE